MGEKVKENCSMCQKNPTASRMKTTITERWKLNDHINQNPVYQWTYETCHVGLSKTDGSWWRVLTKCGPLEKGITNHTSILSVRTPWTGWKGKKMIPEDESTILVDVHCATGEKQRNSSRKNEGAGLKQKWHSAVYESLGESKVQCCKEQYCIGTWNVPVSR